MFRTRTPAAASAIFGAAALATAAAIVTLAGIAAARPPRASPAAGGRAQIRLMHTGLGNVLVDGRGFTVYAFSRDGKGKDRCATTSGCTQTWPVTRTQGSPRAGHGVRSALLGTIRLRGGITQVTYGGHPLYGYSGDSSRGQTDYVGASQFGGVWRAVKASGRAVG